MDYLLLRLNKNMEIKTIKHIKNPLLHREEYVLHISSSSNPSFADIIKHMGKNEELTIVNGVKGNFGTNEFHSEVTVYDSKEARNKIEKISRKERRKLAEEAKKQAEAAKAAGTQ